MVRTRAVDPHSLNMDPDTDPDPDPAFQVISDPDPIWILGFDDQELK
jgi:hypothetical protein